MRRRLIRWKTKKTREEWNDGWSHVKEIQWYSDGSQEVYEKHMDLDCPGCFWSEWYIVDMDGNKKTIFATTGL